MSSTPRKTRSIAICLFGALIGLIGNVRCDYNSYPLAPTFCDDWCRATMRAGCENDEPESCVGGCEHWVADVRCVDELDGLEQCYSSSSDDSFSCSPVGNSRVNKGVCQESRNRWLGCESPEIYACIEQCRPLYDPGIERLQRECPELVPALSCEDLCWSGTALAQESSENVESLLRCFVDVLTRCEPVSRPASQSLREYCESAVQTGRYGAVAGAGGGGGALPM